MKLPTIPGCLQLADPVCSTAGFPRVFSRSYFGDQWLITRNEAFVPLTYLEESALVKPRRPEVFKSNDRGYYWILSLNKRLWILLSY